MKQTECRDHLFFFYCSFSRRPWRGVMLRYFQNSVPIGRDEILCKGLKDWKGKGLKAVVCKFAWGSSVFNL